MISLADMIATFADLFSVELDDNTTVDGMSFLPAIYGDEVLNPREDMVFHSILGRFAICQSDRKLLLAAGSGGVSFPNDVKIDIWKKSSEVTRNKGKKKKTKK